MDRLKCNLVGGPIWQASGAAIVDFVFDTVDPILVEGDTTVTCK